MSHLSFARPALVALVAVSLHASGAPPARAAEPPSAGDGAPRVEGFGLGDGLEGMIDPRDGAVRFALPVAGLSLGWDSRLVGVDRDGLSSGWGWGPGRIEREGGTAVRVASGERFPMDASSPSGLLGYELPDLVFRAEPGQLPARADGVSVDGSPAAPVPYEFVLRELGGRTTYYDTAGAQVAQVAATGERSDWTWSAGEPSRLTGMIGARGEVTRLDWSAGRVVVSTGADRVWKVRFDDGGVTSVSDPVHGVVDVRSEARGLVARIDGVSGASTRFSWRDAPADGVPSVDEVVTFDDDGVPLSSRTWSPVGDGSASGWPVTDPAHGVGRTTGFETRLTDGATRVTSEFDAEQRQTRRTVEVTTGAGEHEVQEHRFRYPGTAAGAPLPRGFAKPSRVEVVFRDTRGSTRTVSEEYSFDALGRLTSRVLPDGTRHSTRYDEERPEPDAPPIGLPLEQRIEAPDGSLDVTVHALTGSRTAVAAVERLTGASADSLIAVGRTEFEVRDDGFVTEQRELPNDGGAPRITRWAETVDQPRAEVTVSETVGVGTPAEASTSRTTSMRHGGLVRQVDALGNRAEFAHDAAGRLTSSTDAAGRRSTVRYESADADGRNAVTTTGPDRVAVTEVRDPLGRVTMLLDNVLAGSATDGHERVIETRAYPQPGTVVVTDAWGATSTARADVLGRPIEATTPTGAVLRTAYDDVAGTTTSGLTPTGDLADAELVTRETRDAMGRIVETTGRRADGTDVPALTVQFDARGRPTTTRVGDLSTTESYGALGEPASTAVAGSTDSTGSRDSADATIVASRRFDGFGASVEQTLADASGSRSGGERAFDAVGRVVRDLDQDHRATVIAYTPDGLVSRVEAPSGQVTETEYDPKTRQPVLSRVTSPVGPPVTTAYEYDPETGLPTAVFDPADRMATEIATTHDAHGNLLTTRYPDGREIRFAYDEHGRRKAVHDVAGNTTTFEYDDAGLLAAAVQTAPASPDGVPGRELARAEYEHDWAGRLTTLARSNGVTTAYTYTSASQVATETTTNGGETQSTRAYTYDGTGLLTERTDEVRSEGGEPQTTTTRYRYDAFGRLTGSSIHDGTADAPARTSTDYTLNASGDLIAEHTVTVATGDATAGDAGGSDEHRGYTYSPRGELIARTVDDGTRAITTTAEYDEAGNLVTAHDGTVYAYDAANRRIGTTTGSGERTTIRYWADGTREQITAVGEHAGTDPRSTRFYWSGGELVNEVHDAGRPPAGGAPEASTDIAAYLLGLDRHARTVQTGDASTTAFYGHDRHGSVVDLTDEQGRVAERYAYTDWGESLGADEPRAVVGDATRNAIGYAGEQHDADGLLHLRARDYDAGTRRLTTVDPVRQHNAYAYADADPITHIDPTGRTASADALNIGFAVFGAALAVAGLLVGGLALTPFGVAAAAANLLDVSIAIVEVVNVAGPRILSAEAATALTVVGVLTGAASLAAGIREAAQRAPKAVAAVADEYHLMEELPPAPKPIAPVEPPTVPEPTHGLSAAELQTRRMERVDLYDGDHREAFMSTMAGMDWMRGSKLTGPSSVSLLASRVREQVPDLMSFALQDTGPFVRTRLHRGVRLRSTLWDEFAAGGDGRPALHRDVVELIRAYWLTANRSYASTSLDMLDHRLGEGSKVIGDLATAQRISTKTLFSTLQEVNAARAVVSRARQLLTQTLRRPY
jgi:RHS repeat-associated protein